MLGLASARMPGARMRAAEPIPDALLRETLGPDDRGAHVASMRRLLHVAMTRASRGLVLAYPARAASGAAQPPSPFAEEARMAVDGAWEQLEEELFGPAEALHATFQALRDELLADVARVGKGLGDLRLDTDLDVTHAVVRYLELVKLAALIERPAGQSVAEALAPVNERIAASVSPMQRDVLQTSTLDELLLDAERDDRARAAARAARSEPSLIAFLPRRGEGLALSASDIETYRACPLRYKFARVLRVPQEPTLNQRFGILVHQVLERYHRRPATRCTTSSTCSTARGRSTASATPTRSASCARRPRRRCASTTSGSPTSPSSRSGSSARSRFGWARTRCAGASTASTGWPAAATSSSTTRPGVRARRRR